MIETAIFHSCAGPGLKAVTVRLDNSVALT